MKFLYYFVDVWGELVFWYLMITCMAIYIKFKRSDVATFLLYELGDSSTSVTRPFYVIFVFVYIFKLLAILIRMREQATVDVTLLDHEKPKPGQDTVSAWRHYFVANELAEL
mmetsp:Transcript_4467/g.6644  ORF Transcript_4467/g.6644 Transcript_4467/m.6644 type:complete len:112 (+) Transcript_4467:1065-1400(+)